MNRLSVSVVLLSVVLVIRGCGENGGGTAPARLTPFYQLHQPKGDVIGRPVRIVTFSFPIDGSMTVAKVTPMVEAEAKTGTDLIVLPEAFLGNKKTQTVEGPAITALSKIAAAYKTYLIVPIDRLDARGVRRNSAVLIDRKGKVAGVYNKVYDLYALPNIYEINVPGLKDKASAPRPGENAKVFVTDFGKIGIAICFDVNFPELWRVFDDGGAELIIWPSAYSSGRCLGAHAINHHYYVVSATGYSRHCQVYDLTGDRILDERTSSGVHISRITLDLDRGIYHKNWNLGPKKLGKLLADHGDKIEVEKRFPDEEWFVLRATKPGVSARRLAAEYGLEELRDYVTRARRLNREFRGDKGFGSEQIDAK